MHSGLGRLKPLSPHVALFASVSVRDQLLVHLADLLGQRHRVQQRLHPRRHRAMGVQPGRGAQVDGGTATGGERGNRE